MQIDPPSSVAGGGLSKTGQWGLYVPEIEVYTYMLD